MKELGEFSTATPAVHSGTRVCKSCNMEDVLPDTHASCHTELTFLTSVAT